MTDSRDGLQSEHEVVWDLLPWYITGTLDAGEAARVRRHLAQCPTCQAELRQQSRLAEGIAEMSLLDCHRERIWSVLQQRIARERTGPTGPMSVRPAMRVPRWGRGLALAAAVAVVAVLAWPHPQPQLELQGGGDPILFETLTDPPADWDGSVLRVKLSPAALPADFDALVSRLELTVIEGPSAARIYTLGLADEGRVGAVVDALRGNIDVEFVTVRGAE